MGPKADAASKEADIGKESSAKALLLVQNSSKEAELLEGVEKPVEVTKEVAHVLSCPLLSLRTHPRKMRPLTIWRLF